MKYIFDISGSKCNVVSTLYKLHAYDYILDLTSEKIQSYKGIVCISGDGTPHEVINGLLSRPDRDECIDIPIGAIHGGSGNALATSVCKLSNE